MLQNGIAVVRYMGEHAVMLNFCYVDACSMTLLNRLAKGLLDTFDTGSSVLECQ